MNIEIERGVDRVIQKLEDLEQRRQPLNSSEENVKNVAGTEIRPLFNFITKTLRKKILLLEV